VAAPEAAEVIVLEARPSPNLAAVDPRLQFRYAAPLAPRLF
jgi:hypothetical protein